MSGDADSNDETKTYPTEKKKDVTPFRARKKTPQTRGNDGESNVSIPHSEGIEGVDNDCEKNR